MEYMTIQTASNKWGISSRRIQVLCAEGRIEGVVKFGRQWAIPEDTNKPSDTLEELAKAIRSGEQ